MVYASVQYDFSDSKFSYRVHLVLSAVREMRIYRICGIFCMGKKSNAKQRNYRIKEETKNITAKNKEKDDVEYSVIFNQD